MNDGPQFIDRQRRRIVLASLASLCCFLLVGGLVAVDRVIGRPDRRAYAARLNDLVSVRDALLLYQDDSGALPPTLVELTPSYLRPDQLARDGQPLYRYTPAKRQIAMAAPVPVRGLWTHRWRPAVLDLPLPQAPREAAEPEVTYAGLLVPVGPELPPAPDGALVFEAEHYSAMNYGWEVHRDDAAGGGAYIHCKEGMGNGPGQSMGIYNFYDVEEGSESTSLTYHFRLEKAGRYLVYGLFYTTGTHCSNCVIVTIDGSDPQSDGGPRYRGQSLRNETPYQWLWTPVEGGAVNLAAGDHYLHVYMHEDGVRLDQIMLTPRAVTGQSPFAANLETGAGTAFAERVEPPVGLTFDYRSMVIGPDSPPEARLAVRRWRSLAGDGRVEAVLREAGPNGADLPLGTWLLKLDELPPLGFLPIDFAPLDLAALPRREYLLTARLLVGDEELASCRVPLMKPFAWEVTGQLPYLHNGQRGPLDGRAEATGEKLAWRPLKPTSWDAFGVMDYGLETIGNSLHAPELATIYARTRIVVPETATYLLKIQSDDQMLLWIDGELVHNHEREAPVTRSAARLPLTIAAGEHEVRMRVNQRAFSSYGDGRWQATLRFRTADDRLSAIVGR